MTIQKIAVIGAGTMGHGIAQVAAMAGFETKLTDASRDALTGALRRIETNLAGAVSRGKLTQAQSHTTSSNIAIAANVETAVGDADLAIEAIVEDLATKQALFQQLDSLAPDRAILATNTSSLPVTHLANARKRAQRNGRQLTGATMGARRRRVTGIS